MAIWDYEGKLESWGWSRIEVLRVLRARLLAFPAKMLRCFAQSACDAILLKLDGVHGRVDEALAGSRGFTSDVPFSPLEGKASARLTAAQPDDAEVDLSAWALPSEMIDQARARVVLRQFVLRWWVLNLRREAI
jgi:hypothetical protein